MQQRPCSGVPWNLRTALQVTYENNHLLPRFSSRVSVVVTKSDEYRRLAQECLATAREIANEEKRTSLIHMAQVWLRLAEEQDAPPPTATNESQAVVQQQQQAQPKKDGE
jgi:hypothetical protein